LEIATDEEFTNIVSGENGIKQPNYSDNTLESETTYYWRVFAYNICVAAPVSNTFSFTTEITCFEADVPTIDATELNVCDGHETTLSIASGDLNDATDWEWYTSSCGGTILGTGTSIIVSPTEDTDYFVRGVGGCTEGTGPCGSISVAIITLDPTVEGVVNSTVLMSLQDSDATYQWIDCNNGNEPIPGATEQFYEVTENGSYAVIVTSTINTECFVISDCFDVINVGVEEIENTLFSVFPNPSDGKYKINFNSVNNFNQYEITDYRGRLLLIAELNGELDIEINLTEESEGIYFLKMKSNSEIKVVKLIKQ